LDGGSAQSSLTKNVDHFADLNILKEFVKHVHGSFETKDTLNLSFREKFPLISTYAFQ
jgi:hypothetical protein